ncbi:MAG TPA: sigma 54-interacting transcriptional regulator [Vicinamibacterales bacterium]|nr:sigma 54-interacting transcriptional regulator [Vicinamibacterales bacterium]
MDAALRAAATTLQSASESGHERTRLATYINLGHIHIARDELDRADRCLANAWRICHISPRCREPLIGALAELELARGNHPKCQTLLEQLWEIDSPPHSHSKLWAYRTEIEMLAQSGRWSEALRAADRAIVEASRANSSRIHLLLRLQKAEVLAVLGDVVGVIRDVSEALSEQEDHSVEVLAEVQRVVGRALSRAGDIQAARDALKRSRRIFMALGNRRAARDLVRLEREERLEATSDEHRPGIRPDLLLRRFAALLQQATRADLLGVEALELLLEAGVTQRAAVAFKPPFKPLAVHHAESWTAAEVRAAAERDDAVLPLGTWRDAEWMLVADVPQTVAARAAWLALRTIVRSGLELAEARRESRERQALWPIENPDAPSHGVFGSEQMTELLRITKRIATTDVTVLITGETGVGKEVLARVLHDASPRAGKPFVPLNCSAVPRDMLEAQLFGHRRGAFTGADTTFPGVLRAAAGGTVFLDEIGEVGLDLQPKLLRFLESGEVHPLGEPQPVKVNVRVVAATNQDLDRLVREGRFREDLYYRLNVIHLKVPPLRERREEIPLLVSHFLERFAREYGKGRLRIADETMEYLVLYAWPGNVRELANEVRRLAALAEPDAVLMPEHLSPALSAGRRTRPASERDLMPTELVVRLDQPLAAATEHLERAMIQHAMALCNGRVDQVARMLGLSRKGLYLKRQRLKLDAFAS